MNREEAIDIIRKNIPHLGIGAAEMTAALNELIPVLCESEDKKAKKIIESIFSEAGYRYIQKSERAIVLAYLEKQG